MLTRRRSYRLSSWGQAYAHIFCCPSLLPPESLISIVLPSVSTSTFRHRLHFLDKNLDSRYRLQDVLALHNSLVNLHTARHVIPDLTVSFLQGVCGAMPPAPTLPISPESADHRAALPTQGLLGNHQITDRWNERESCHPPGGAASGCTGQPTEIGSRAAPPERPQSRRACLTGAVDRAVTITRFGFEVIHEVKQQLVLVGTVKHRGYQAGRAGFLPGSSACARATRARLQNLQPCSQPAIVNLRTWLFIRPGTQGFRITSTGVPSSRKGITPRSEGS